MSGSDKKNTKAFNLLGSMAMCQTPVYIQLLDRICQDYNLEDKKEEMIERYIHKDNKVWKKMINKLKPKNTRSKSGYTIFLSDPVNIDKIKNENKGIMMKRLNPNKGDKWKSLRKNNTDLYDRYNNVAKLFNHKLIQFDDNNKEEIRNIIKIWMYEKSIDDINNLLKNIKNEKKTNKKKEDKKEEDKKEETKSKNKKKAKKKKKDKKEVEPTNDESSEFDVNDTE